MFDQFKNLGQIAGLMKDAGRIKEQLQQAQEELKHARVTAETGGGAVRATASGNLRIVSIEVDPALLATLVDADNADDRHLAEDLIAGAVNAALEKARQTAAEELAKRAHDLGLPMSPDMDLTSLLGS
jgi:DNA-binding YbaB/EbfC family protein